MDELLSRLRGFITIREVSLFFLCCVATYLFRVRRSYSVVPAWRIDIDQSHYQNEQYAQPWETLPLPVISDVESDNSNELVLTTTEPHLQLLKSPKHLQSASSVLPYMVLVQEVSLVTGNVSFSDRQPKALATGYLETYKSMLQVRKQVIVVVTCDWTVMCFDHSLNLLWETQLMTVLDSRYYIQEISLLVTSYNVIPGDGGLVIVGASLADRYHKQSTLKHDHRGKRESHIHKEEEEWQKDLNLEADDQDPGPILNHYSTFALSGVNGTIRWHHLPGDFQESRTTKENMFSAHHFKLALQRGSSHIGEKHWNQYNQAILKHMPHHWQHSSDTSVTIARVVKDTTTNRETEESESTPALPSLIGLDEEHVAGFHFGGLRPHTPSEHVKNPNAVFIHMRQGIEVLDLATGAPLTRLKLPTEGAVTYADVDNNGIVDQVKAHFTTDENHVANCMAVVKSGIPPQSLLFNASICEAQHSFVDSLSVSLFGQKSQIKENLKLAVAPVTVPSIAKRSGVINHLLGANLFQRRSGGLDSIFLISNGRVVSYGPKGQFNWKIDTKAKWNDVLTVFKSKHYFPQEINDRYHYAFQPSMQAMPLKVYGRMDAAVLAGWDHLVVISLEDGHVIADHSLPCQPSASPVIGDFNSNGYNDIIVLCSNGLFGFRLEPNSAYWLTAIIGLCIVAVVLGLATLCSYDHHHFFEDEAEHIAYQEDNHQAGR